MTSAMKTLPLIAGLLLVSANASAEELAPETVITIKGTCEEFTLGGEDLTDLCAPDLLQISYVGGQVELFVTTEDSDGRFLVFVGAGAREGDSLVQTVDTLTILPDPMQDSLDAIKAKGECRHGDPFAGPASFTCAVRGADGEGYTLSFLSDGETPESMID